MIPVNRPRLAGKEREYLLECVDSGWISSEGPFVKRFEQGYGARLGRRHAISVNSGTAALEAAVLALQLQSGDEVIVPTFTIISCASAIVRAGATPVVVDCDPLTWNMDVEQVRARITPRTRAIMPVHIYGLPVEMDPILELAREHGLRVVEDAAEAIGLQYKGRECGSMGDVSCISFYANKHITTGEGGMILTSDDAIAERCARYRNLCFEPARRFVHEELGWNYRMCNLQAALGVAQLEKVDESIAIKRRMGRLYQEVLAETPGLQLPQDRTPSAENVYWVFGVVLGDDVPFDAVEAATRLAAKGVQTRPFFWPLHEQPVLRKMGLFADERHPVAERLARRGLYLPSGLGTSEEEIRASAAALREILA
jgi:perosamine synthetase